jgi:hypothetical protein
MAVLSLPHFHFDRNYSDLPQIRLFERTSWSSQLMVVACILSIFVMNQFDSVCIKFSLGLLIVSELLDMIWLFMNAKDFWNPPAVGISSKG